MSPRVAVPLRILRRRAVDVEYAFARPDAVVGDVRRLALAYALGEVPREAVVARRLGHARIGGRGGASAQKREFLVEKRRHLVREAEHRTRQIERTLLHVVERALRDERVLRVRIRLRAEERVELAHARLRQEELLREIDARRAGRLEHAFGAVEERLVQFEKPDLRQVVVVERDVALVGAPDLLEHREPGVGLVRVEVLHALRERRYLVQDALEPPFRKLLRRPVAPSGADGERRERSFASAVAERVVGVDVLVGPRALRAEEDRVEPGRAAIIRPRRVFVVGGGESAVGRGRGAAPLELEVVRRAAERRAVLERELLGKLVQRILQNSDAVNVEFRNDAQNLHRDGKPRADLLRIRVVVFDERHPAGARAVRDERVVVARQVERRGQTLRDDGGEVHHDLQIFGENLVVRTLGLPLEPGVFLQPVLLPPSLKVGRGCAHRRAPAGLENLPGAGGAEILRAGYLRHGTRDKLVFEPELGFERRNLEIDGVEAVAPGFEGLLRRECVRLADGVAVGVEHLSRPGRGGDLLRRK